MKSQIKLQESESAFFEENECFMRFVCILFSTFTL